MAGPPCQSWSSAGNHAGLDDLKGRGIVFYHCLNYICGKRPRVAVIENVKGLQSGHVEEFLDILKILTKADYDVTWEILDAAEHGLPQSRPRVYIVAIRLDSKKHDFTFPAPVSNRPDVDLFLEPKEAKRPQFHTRGQTAKANLADARAKLKEQEVDDRNTTCFVDLFAPAQFSKYQQGFCPCITATRGAQGGYFITSRNRLTTMVELARLQGWPTEVADRLVATKMPNKVLGKALGNGMSVNVVVRLLPRVLWAAGLLPERMSDVWKTYSKKTIKALVMPDDMYGQACKKAKTTPSAG